jgi:hypothetical protein
VHQNRPLSNIPYREPVKRPQRYPVFDVESLPRLIENATVTRQINFRV